jgi:hypothetical protein
MRVKADERVGIVIKVPALAPVSRDSVAGSPTASDLT